MTLYAQTEQGEIQHHDDLGVEVVETDYDAMVRKNGEWWNLDMQTGELTNRVEVH